MEFKLQYQDREYHFSIPLFGVHNIRNAVAVIILALHEKLPVSDIQAALLTFKNVRRRLQLLTSNRQVKVFDDFAHHPTAIAATLKALRQSWPSGRIHAVYEARSNTSVRKHHQPRMAESFAEADSVVFYKIYRQERIDPDERLDLGQVAQELEKGGVSAKLIEDLNQIVEECQSKAIPGDIFIFMSNGAFGGIQHRLAEQLY